MEEFLAFVAFLIAYLIVVFVFLKRKRNWMLDVKEEQDEAHSAQYPGLHGISDIAAYESQKEIFKSCDKRLNGDNSARDSNYSADSYSPTPSSYDRDTRTDAYTQRMQECRQEKRREERRAESRARSEAYAAARREAKERRQASSSPGSRGYAASKRNQSSSASRSSARSSSRGFGGGSSRGGGSGRKF